MVHHRWICEQFLFLKIHFSKKFFQKIRSSLIIFRLQKIQIKRGLQKFVPTKGFRGFSWKTKNATLIS